MFIKVFCGVYCLFLLGLSVCKSAELLLPEIHGFEAWLGGDKLMHLKLALLLSFVILTAFAPKGLFHRAWRVLLIMLLLIIALCIDELHQLLLGSRRFEWLDTAYGVLGLGLGLLGRLLLDCAFIVVRQYKLSGIPDK